jgi:cytochrome b561
MQIRNTTECFGLVAILLHWIGALALFGLFGLGLWMTSLNYYDPWYHRAPDLHRSSGVLVLGLFLVRLGWRWANPRPRPIGRPWEQQLAALVHGAFYLLVLCLATSGYLISTSDGRSLEVFDWFAIPSLTGPMEELADPAGRIHYALALTLMGLAGLHLAAALKHQFIDRDGILLRMFGINPRQPPDSHP